MPEPIRLEFNYKKSTVGTHAFKEVTTSGSPGPVVGSIYISKRNLPHADESTTLTAVITIHTKGDAQ